MTWEELWAKYEAQVRDEEPTLAPEEVKERVCLRILEKSCCTSEKFDNLAGLGENDCQPTSPGGNVSISGKNSRGSVNAGSSSDSSSRSADINANAVVVALAAVAAARTEQAETQQTEGDVSPTASAPAGVNEDLERMSAVEGAVAVAGVLRLTRLVKPFVGGNADTTEQKRVKAEAKAKRRRPRIPLGRSRFTAERSASGSS